MKTLIFFFLFALTLYGQTQPNRPIFILDSNSVFITPDSAKSLIGDSTTIANIEGLQDSLNLKLNKTTFVDSLGNYEIAYIDQNNSWSAIQNFGTTFSASYYTVSGTDVVIGSYGSGLKSYLSPVGTRWVWGDLLSPYNYDLDTLAYLSDLFTTSDETDQVWVSDSSTYLSKYDASQTYTNFTNGDETDQVWVSDSSTYLSKYDASQTYLTGNESITLSGDASGSGTTSISVTVADDSHNHVISNVDNLQTNLDSKLNLTAFEDSVQAFESETDRNHSYLSFDGTDDYVSVADDDTLDFGDATYEVLFMLNSTSTNQTLLNKRLGGDGYFIEYTTSNSLRIYIGGASAIHDYNLSSSGLITANKLYHLVVIKDASEADVFVYLNGALQTGSAGVDLNTIGGVNNTEPLLIGQRGSANYINGKIYKTELFDHPLSATEVDAMWNNGDPLGYELPDSLDQYLAFAVNAQNSDGTTLYDLSGNGNDGTISGATLVKRKGIGAVYADIDTLRLKQPLTDAYVANDITINTTKALSGTSAGFTTGVNMATTSGNVGIGNASPLAKLHVSGDIRLGAGTGAVKILGAPNSGGYFDIGQTSGAGSVRIVSSADAPLLTVSNTGNVVATGSVTATSLSISGTIDAASLDFTDVTTDSTSVSAGYVFVHNGIVRVKK
jgi:hypothetical protein